MEFSLLRICIQLLYFFKGPVYLLQKIGYSIACETMLILVKEVMLPAYAVECKSVILGYRSHSIAPVVDIISTIGASRVRVTYISPRA